MAPLIHAAGLFAVVRHPNFLLYALYRSFGTPLASGLWWAPLAMLAFTLNIYRTDSLPNLEKYMDWKYKEKWQVSWPRGAGGWSGRF